eukprot:3823533-Lingulodinium_polyedra.AAC.1
MRAELDGLKAQLGEQAARMEALQQRVDQTAAATIGMQQQLPELINNTVSNTLGPQLMAGIQETVAAA